MDEVRTYFISSVVISGLSFCPGRFLNLNVSGISQKGRDYN